MTMSASITNNKSVIQYRLKRIMDYTLSTIGLVCLSPILAAVAILVYKEDRGPIFYKQERVGLNGKVFKIWKFRSMVMDADKLMTVLEVHNESKDGVMFKMTTKDPRVTKIGSFIRQWSIDELPQLINILKGEMSFIGPRPYSLRDWGRLPLEFHNRTEVLPGLTCLWQIYGGERWNLTTQEIYELDRFYIENFSIGLDLSIFLKTIQVVLLRKGTC